MAIEIGALRAMLSASSAAFAADMGKARQALQTNASKMRRAMGQVGDAFKSALGHLKRFSGLAIAGGAAGMAALIKKSIDTATELGKFSTAVGVSVESLSSLNYAAALTGVELEDLADGLKTLAENAVDFAIDTGPAVEAFKAMEINVKDSNGAIKAADVLMLEMADKFAALEDGALKTAFAAQVFGDEAGVRLTTFLNQGSEAIRRQMEEARQLGLVVDDEAVAAARNFNAQLATLTARLQGFGMQIATNALPALNQMVATLVQASNSGDKFGTALWKSLRSPGELKRAREEVEKWAEIQRKMSGTVAERLEVLPYKLVDYEGELAAARTRLAMAEFEVRKQKEAHDAAVETARAEEERQKQEAENRRQNTIATTERLLALEEEKRKKEELEALEKAAAERAEREAERVKDLGEDTITSLEREIALFDSSSRAQRVQFEIAHGNMQKLSEDHKQRILELARELDLLETLAEFDEEFADMGKGINQTTDEMTRNIERWGERSTDALTEFVTTGKASFTDFANSVIRDLIRMQVQQRLTGPLFEALGATFGAPAVEGRAFGGRVRRGGFYEVNERGPELLQMGNRQFLMMSQREGSVTPLAGEAAGKLATGEGPNLRIVNVLDPNVMDDWASSPMGERIILNTMARNKTQIKRILN